MTMPDSLFRDSLVRVVEALDQRDYGGLRSFAVIARVRLTDSEYGLDANGDPELATLGR